MEAILIYDISLIVDVDHLPVHECEADAEDDKAVQYTEPCLIPA